MYVHCIIVLKYNQMLCCLSCQNEAFENEESPESGGENE